MFDPSTIPRAFITHAANVLGDTDKGLSGSEIVKYCTDYAVDFNFDIPHAEYPFDAPNKRTALKENLSVFSPQLQYKIIKEFCESERIKGYQKVKDLKIKLVSRFSQFAETTADSEINESLIEETRHWLQEYPESLRLYQEALTKFQNGVFTRNLLDDLRLSLELLLKAIFNSNKSLENQIVALGNHLKTKGGSKELTNMFVKLVDYFCLYQNSYVKHDDAVIEEEIEFIFEITSSFMKHIVRLS
ncbi:MAG: hypothetical protein KAR20_28570 [Candidatus Heimdallarchaeota archaeon]|nr:hypothetical protein [Candidatus Heimdallarchaeota archaeon]